MNVRKKPETSEEGAAAGPTADHSAQVPGAAGEGAPSVPSTDGAEPEEPDAPIAALDAAGRERPIVGGSFVRAEDGTITRREA